MDISIQDRFDDRRNNRYKNFLLRDITRGRKFSNLRYLPDVGKDRVSSFLGTDGPIFKQLLEDFKRKNPEPGDLDSWFDIIDADFDRAMLKIIEAKEAIAEEKRRIQEEKLEREEHLNKKRREELRKLREAKNKAREEARKNAKQTSTKSCKKRTITKGKRQKGKKRNRSAK